ncbi:MAG: ferrous iron transport protein A [Thermoplasmata archaeon]|nr:MAG: ferrous iron transport protein A [Thermoplasmata archaeon]
MRVSLLALPVGEEGIVSHIMGGPGFIRRLECMGVRIGKKVRKVASQPFRGPVIIEVDRTKIALGRGIASRIIVEVLS